MGLPIQYLTPANAERVGAKMGLFRGVETKKPKEILRQGFLQFRVELPLNQAITGGFFLNITSNDYRWIQFKYEILPAFCYRCGMFGHDKKSCEVQQVFVH